MRTEIEGIVIRCPGEYLQVFVCLNKFQRREGGYAVERLSHNTFPLSLCLSCFVTDLLLYGLRWAAQYIHLDHTKRRTVNTADAIKTEAGGARCPGVAAHLEASFGRSVRHWQPPGPQVRDSHPQRAFSGTETLRCFPPVRRDASMHEVGPLRTIFTLFSVKCCSNSRWWKKYSDILLE